MIDDIGEELDGTAETWRTKPSSFPTTITGFKKLERKLQQSIIRQQQYLDVIRHRALGLLADYEQSVVADDDVAWLPKHRHIVNLSAEGSLANRKCTISFPAAHQSW